MPTLTVTVTSRTGTATISGVAGFDSLTSPYDALNPSDWAGQGLLFTSLFYFDQDQYNFTSLTELYQPLILGQSYYFNARASYYDALSADPYLVTGTNPEASSSSIDLLVPELSQTINFTVTAVSLNISLTGGTADTPYLILLKFLDTNSKEVLNSIILNSDSSGNASFDYQVQQPRMGETLTYQSASYRDAYPQRTLTTDERLQALENP